MWNEVEQNRNQEHRNVAFNAYRAAFNYNVEIVYSSQQIIAIGPIKFKNEADRMCCASGQVKLMPL